MRTVSCRVVGPVIMLLAILVSTVAPCLASTPGAKARCPMAGCGDARGASFDAARPCCCAIPAATDNPVTGVTLPAPQSAHVGPALSVAPTPGPNAAAALDGSFPPSSHVPLYLLNTSLLI